MSLDVYDLCILEFQVKFQFVRDKFKELEDKKVEEMIQVMYIEELILLYFCNFLYIEICVI